MNVNCLVEEEWNEFVDTFLVLTSWTLPGKPHSLCYHDDCPCHPLARPHQPRHQCHFEGLPCTGHFHGMLCCTPGRRRTSTQGIFLDSQIWYLQPGFSWKDTSTMKLNRLKWHLWIFLTQLESLSWAGERLGRLLTIQNRAPFVIINHICCQKYFFVNIFFWDFYIYRNFSPNSSRHASNGFCKQLRIIHLPHLKASKIWFSF